MSQSETQYLLDIPGDINPLDVQRVLGEAFAGRINVAMSNNEVETRKTCAERLRKLGPTRLIESAAALQEMLLSKGQPPTAIGQAVNGLLRQQAVAPSEIIICDPYLFSSTRGSQTADIVDEMWTDLADTAQRVLVLTLPHEVDYAVKNDVESKLKARNAAISLEHRRTSDYHDRFWILDRKFGVFVGASVNGFGHKYALADILKPDDVTEIITALSTGNFL